MSYGANVLFLLDKGDLVFLVMRGLGAEWGVMKWFVVWEHLVRYMSRVGEKKEGRCAREGLAGYGPPQKCDPSANLLWLHQCRLFAVCAGLGSGGLLCRVEVAGGNISSVYFCTACVN